MIYDCFTFFDELDLLEIRLAELAQVVDRFVLVESTVTFTGRPKPLYFADNRTRFQAFADRIMHVVVSDMPENPPSAWEREHFQRNAILRGLGSAAPTDVIIISDVDEIPRASCLSAALDHAAALEVRCYYYTLNCYNVSGPEVRLPRIITLPRRELKLPEQARQLGLTAQHTGACQVIPEGGWHFSYLADAERIKQKIDAFSHQELNLPRFTDAAALRQRMAEATDLFERPGYRWRYVDIDDTYPRYVRENQDRFAHYIRPLTAADRELLRMDREAADLTAELQDTKAQLRDAVARRAAAENELTAARSAHMELQRSMSYLLGRALTWPYRVARANLQRS